MESDLRDYKDVIKNRTREFFARNLAWIDILITESNNDFSGTKYPITGNGELTWKSRDLNKK